LKKQVRRKRNNAQAVPDAPKDLTTLEIPDVYKMYSPSEGHVEPFLLADSGPGTERILIFGRRRYLDILRNSKTWLGDGTFKISPPLFTQVYVILAEYLNGVHPIIYALLPDKFTKTYEKLFQMLINLCPELCPTSISLDYELAAINAVKKHFPNIIIYGCFFHLTKNFKKKIGELHLISKYNNDADFSISVKMIIAIAFVCINKIDIAIDALAENLPEELQPLLEWFEDNYVGRLNRNGRGRRLARFPPSIWNLNERVLNGIHRTNNHAEAANRRINVEMGMVHPTLWSFITCLRKIQAGRDTYLFQLESGRSPPKKLKKYIDTDKRLLKIVQESDTRDILTYLRGVAHNISLQ